MAMSDRRRTRFLAAPDPDAGNRQRSPKRALLKAFGSPQAVLRCRPASAGGTVIDPALVERLLAPRVPVPISMRHWAGRTSPAIIC
jgi:hypothetical protein